MDNLTSEQTAQKSQAYYDEKLKEILEPAHTGKFVAIEIESGEYFLGDSILEALQKAKMKHPQRLLHTIRVGYPGVFKMGSASTRGILYSW